MAALDPPRDRRLPWIARANGQRTTRGGRARPRSGSTAADGTAGGRTSSRAERQDAWIGATDAIEEYFREYFRTWEIALPRRDVDSRAGGHIFERGWHVGYVWGREQDEEYLEVLAQHRMTDDRHFRVFASGRVEELPAPATFYAYGPNATEEERLEAERQYVERNQRIYEELRARGLLPPHGGNLPAHEINEYLRSGRDRGSAPDRQP